MSTRQLLDEVRKIVISLTSSVQAFVIFPHSIDEHHEQDSNDSSSSADDNYYTLLADQPNLLEVIFEGGDLELRALESLRTHATPEVSDDNADAGHYWQTWTIRKIQSDSTTPRNPADWFSLIVPFQLRNGKRAVLSLARNSAAYTTVDLECIKWISKILSYSLELKGDNLTLEETHQSIKYLQGEVMRLSDLDNQLANFELDTESLEHTLYAADVLNNSYFDSVIATAQNKSVSKSIEKIEEEIIFNSFRYIFGDVNFQLWPADVAKSSYGVTLPLDKYEMKLQKGIEKVINGNVVTDNGKITFWIDGSNANYDGLDFFKMMQYNKQRLVNSPDREHQQDATHFDSVVSITCYFVLQVKGYGLSWIKIGPKSKLPINYKLRLLILMRLLEVHYQWQHRVESIVSSHTEVQKSFDEEKLNYLNELQLRAADVQRLQNMYVEGNETSKDEQKQLLQHKRLVRKMVERVHHEAAVQCNELLGVSSAKLKNNDVQYFQNIGQTIIEGARSIVSHTSCEVHAMIYTSNRETKQSTITWLTDKLVLEMYVEKAASIRNAPQLENIVEIVNHNRLLVLLQESMEENYVEYLTNSVGAVCTSLADGLTLSITRGPMSTNFFFLPFPVDRGKTLILMVNIRSIFDKGMRSVCISKHVVNASIAALTLLRSTVVHILSTKTELLELVDRCKNVSTLILSQVTSNRTIEQLNKQLSFEKLKNNKLETKLGSAESNLIELSLIRNRIRYLEQSSADWKELVKGINGSTLSIARGIPSLWAQSCSVLISILTSKISISGCGLIVKNDDNILEEFCVKELSTPVIDRHNFHDITNESLYLDSSNANDDAITNYIRGMLELRLASDLGAVVESLAVDIINGNSGQQRSFKLVRPSAGKEESLWLVPIRTARAVLAVLRVSVHEVDVNENRQGGVPDSAVKAGLSIDGGKKVDVNLVSEMIQNSMINFAELLAPLVVAAECIEKERLLKLKAESSKDETGATLRKAMDEASLTAKSMNTFSAAIQSITSRDVMKYLHQNNLQEICQKIVNNVSEALAVTAVIKIESEPSAIRSERNFVERNPLEVSESLVDSTGKAIGSMSLIFEQISEPINSSFALDDEAMYNKTTSNEYDRNKYLNMTKVMRVVGSIVSSIVSSVQNNQRTTGRITSLSEELHIAENQLETAKVAIESLHQKEAELISIRDGYQSINTILSMCLSGKIHAGNTNKTVDILHIMSTKLAEIAGVSGGFNFILVDNDKEEELDEILVSSEHDQLRLLKKKLKWISDGVGSSPAVNENIREIGLNLAITCIEKKIKNVFDIGLPTGSGNFRRGLAGVDTTINFDQSLVYDNERDTTLRILTYPLGNDRDNKCFGCLQVIVDTLVDTSKLDYYCEEAAIASTYILSSHSINKLHTSQQQSLEVDLVLTETKKNEFEVLKEMWEQRANAWQAVATVASILSRECVRDAPYMNVLQSESIASALYNSGIHIVLHIKGKTFSTGLSIPVTDNCAARAVIPIDGSNKSTVEILCDNRIKSTFYNTDANGIATIAVDVVEKLSNVIQNTLLIHSTKSAELDATIKERTYAEEKIEKLKQSVKVAKDELNKSMITRSSASNEYLQVVQFLEKYKQHVHGGMNEFIMPLVIELCTVFEQVNSQVLLYKNNITKLLDWNWNSLVRIADKAIQKISSGSFTYHISILLRMEVVGEKATEVPVASTDVKKKEAKKSKSETAKANTPSKPKSSPYMDKIDVKVYGNPSTINNIYTIDPSQTSGYYGHLTKEKSSKSNKAKRLLHTTSVLLKCFSVGTIQESIDELLPSDLVGIDPTVIPTIVDDEERIPSVLAIPILGQKGAVTAIVRLVYSKPPLVQKTKSKKEMIPTMAGEEEVKANTTKAIKSVSNTNTANQPGIKDIENFNNSLIVPVLEIIMMFGNVLSQLLLASSSRYNEVTNFSAEKDEVKAKAEEVQFLLERSRKMHRIICRESSILLDPPMIGPPGGIAPRAVHPAALTPLSASQDTCLKLLSMLRTLLRSEGQALLLRDSSTDPTTFQIIYTGDALYWPGIEQGTFGIVASSSPSRTSLIETVMNTRKPIAVSNATSDTRYCAYLDGICTNGTPVIVAPIRGRSGVVVGALVAARGKESNIFTVEDVSALEMISSFGSLSLYWCQGLGSLHHQLTKNINKMTQLERIVQKMNTKVNK